MNDRKKMFADMVRSVENPPTGDAMALGHLMRDWLEAMVANAGTSVDTGGGFGGYDLWVKMGNAEYIVTIKKARDLASGEQGERNKDRPHGDAQEASPRGRN